MFVLGHYYRLYLYHCPDLIPTFMALYKEMPCKTVQLVMKSTYKKNKVQNLFRNKEQVSTNSFEAPLDALEANGEPEVLTHTARTEHRRVGTKNG